MNTTITDDQMTKLFVELFRQKGVNPERVQQILKTGILADVLDPEADLTDREGVRGALKLGKLLPEKFTLEVDYDKSLEEMIAAGRYDWKNSDITADRFPVKGKGKKKAEVELVHFNRDISSEDAIAEMDKLGLRPATIEELLAFGAANPDIQRKFPIVALGSVAEVSGSRFVAYLRRVWSERSLSLGWFAFDWNPDCRFLAVRK